MRSRHFFLSASVSLLLWTAAPAVQALGPTPGSPGTITISDKKIEPSAASNAKELKEAAKSALTKPADADGWKVYFVAHLSRPPGADDVNIVFYDQAPPKPGQPREPVNAYPIRTKKDAKIMMADIEIRPEDGFKAGGKYNVLITRLIGGKEEVYARTTLELK